MMEISRNPRLPAIAGGTAAVLALAFLIRSNTAFDVLSGLVLIAIAAVNGAAVLDARLPLLVADAHGVRMRLGSTWVGLPWVDLDEVEHLPQLGWWRDGRLVLLPHEEDVLVGGLERRGRMHAIVNNRLYGAPFVVPLGVATRVVGGSAELASRLADLSGGVTSIVKIEADFDAVDGRINDITVVSGASARAEGAEHTVEVPRMPRILEFVGPDEPLIGPTLAVAREAMGLSVEQLAERTRIGAHIITAIERDAFAACGGDFYARGHLRTLSRVLSVDVRPLLVEFDLLYADGPGPIAVPEPSMGSSLAGSTGGALRHSSRPRNVSLVVAGVMAVVLMGSLGRLVFDGSAADPTPKIGLSSGSVLDGGTGVPVTLLAKGGKARVVVRDRAGNVVYTGALAFGQSQTIKANPPISVQSTEGSLLVTVAGEKPVAVGKTGRKGQRTYAGSHD